VPLGHCWKVAIDTTQRETPPMSPCHLAYTPWIFQRALPVAVLWLLITCASQTMAQLSAEDIKAVVEEQAKAVDPHVIALAIHGRESTFRDGPEASKLSGIGRALDGAVSIYRTRDLSMPTDRSPNRWPDFRVNGKMLFGGTDPAFITDPKVRAEYEKVLADNEKLLTRYVTEKHKLEEGDYCARSALRIFQSSANQATLKEAVAKHLASLPEAPWIKERLAAILFPKPQPQEPSTPAKNPGNEGKS
jgi:hypothetical protein